MIIEISSSEQPNTEGRAAGYQEKKIRHGKRMKIPAVTMGELLTYARTILHFELCDRLGKADLPPIFTNLTGIWFLQNCPNLGPLFKRFYMYLRGDTLQQIAESEGAHRDGIFHYLKRHSLRIRSLFDKLGGKDQAL
jgi:hypothetical protein